MFFFSFLETRKTCNETVERVKDPSLPVAGLKSCVSHSTLSLSLSLSLHAPLNLCMAGNVNMKV